MNASVFPCVLFSRMRHPSVRAHGDGVAGALTAQPFFFSGGAS